MERYRKILEQVESHHAPILLRDHGLVCKLMKFGDEDVVLYLAKPHWTNRFDDNRKSTIGVFCSIWVAPELLEKSKFAYNIHSMKLRNLPGYKLASRKFASEFRGLVGDRVANWPEIRLDYGPLTLLEGREICELGSFAEKVGERLSGFASIHQDIDNILDASKTVSK